MKEKIIFILGYLFFTIVLLIHILIIAKIIPFTWINGGRSESYEAQLQLSLSNFVIVFIGYLYVFVNQRFQQLRSSKLFKVFKWITVIFWSVSLISQFLGTSFEIFVMAPVVVFGIYVHFRIARLG